MLEEANSKALHPYKKNSFFPPHCLVLVQIRLNLNFLNYVGVSN